MSIMNSARQLQNWFKIHIKDDGKVYTLDKNQAAIVLDAHKNTLVTARAGSGKTRTIVAKIAYLLAHEKVAPEEIIVFAFNRKAKTEINERLTKITFDGTPLFTKTPALATTFHAFAYQILGGKKVVGEKLISETAENKLVSSILKATFPELKQLAFSDFLKQVETAKQFITRAEQKFFLDYTKLYQIIDGLPEDALQKSELVKLSQILQIYQQKMRELDYLNFNQMIALAAPRLAETKTPYRYIFVDEYQDFSMLFLNLILSLRKSCPKAKLLAVGDDWQAINRFAGSDVEYFTHFEKYFPEDFVKLFIPTNYRSGKKIVENANFFMSRALKDYNGCKSGNKLKAKIYLKDVAHGKENQFVSPHASRDIPLLLQNYLRICLKIIAENRDKTIKILSRNNDLSFRDWSLTHFVSLLKDQVISKNLMTASVADALISESTIHRSKGLESDVVILLEIDAEKFPSHDKTGGLYQIFGDTEKTLFQDEARLFYVALTRPKEKLFILSKTTKVIKSQKKLNFFSYLNDEWLEPLS